MGQKYLKKRFSTVEKVEHDRKHAGCYFIVKKRKGKKPIKIEVKGCSRL